MEDYASTPRELGMLLRRLREDVKVSQSGLADAAGVSRRWIINFEAGKPSVEMSKVMDCFQALGYGFQPVRTGSPERT